MALRARAMTVSGVDNLAGNENVAPTKQFIQAPKTTRAALGDLRNKARSVSLTTEQQIKEAKIAAAKPRRKISPTKENPISEKVQDEIEKMDVSAVVDQEIEDIDKEDVGNPQLVVEYVQDIYAYLRFLEKEQNVIANYLNHQKVIMPKMRAVLVDWLVGVHLQFRLLPETMYTAVAILDRYMQQEVASVTRNTLQLVGVGAMLIASKYEEIYAPEVKDFVYITDKAYTEKEILKMELKILDSLKFNLGRPLPLHFLRRASKAGGVEASTHTLAKYIMELSLPEYELISLPPSLLAAASLALSIRILEPGISSMKEVWSPALQHYTRYQLSELTSAVEKLASLLIAAPTAKLSAVYSKYSNKKFFKISRIPALGGDILKEIAAGNVQ